MSYEIPMQGMDLLKYHCDKVQESFRRHAQMEWHEAEAIEERMGDPELDAMWGRDRHGYRKRKISRGDKLL